MSCHHPRRRAPRPDRRTPLRRARAGRRAASAVPTRRRLPNFLGSLHEGTRLRCSRVRHEARLALGPRHRGRAQRTIGFAAPHPTFKVKAKAETFQGIRCLERLLLQCKATLSRLEIIDDATSDWWTSHLAFPLARLPLRHFSCRSSGLFPHFLNLQECVVLWVAGTGTLMLPSQPSLLLAGPRHARSMQHCHPRLDSSPQ